MLMLQTVIRPSIERASMAGPRYSTTYPWPPPVPVWVIRVSTRSLAVTPAGSAPLTVTAIVFGRAWGRVWVASTCSTSLVPMPKASAPNAPCVLVCESPQTMVMPGWVSPSWGPMMWTMPWSMSPSGCSRTPNSSALRRSVSTCVRLTGSAIGLSQSIVGTLWSSVARVRSGRRTLRPASRRPSKACGRGHLVDEVEVDEKEVGLAVRTAYDVLVPDLFGQGPAHESLLCTRLSSDVT